MISINLTPAEELENRYWWAPDAILLAAVLMLSVGALLFYTHQAEQEIVEQEIERDRVIEETQQMNLDVDKFNGLNQKIRQLDSKKNALQRITQSKLLRFLPIIILENIQNLKPDGVWLSSLAFVDKKAPAANDALPRPAGVADVRQDNPQPNQQAQVAFEESDQSQHQFNIEIEGFAASNVILADFMMALKTTQNQAYEKSDLRTQLFFSDVDINFAKVLTERGENSSVDLVNFKLILNSSERQENDQDKSKNFSNFMDEFRLHGQASMN